MGCDHHAAPLFDALKRFVERDQAPFYSPGHKGGRTLDPWFRAHLAEVDLNNLPDTDTLHCPEGPIAEAEALVADAWGVGKSFILVQGSTSGNVAVALSALRPGEPVLVARNAHKSVLAGLVQVGARPVWLEPRWDETFGVAHGLDARVVERAFAETSARALWVLHPTYYGTTGDVVALADLCGRHDAKLLVDGAHSPHFAFHPDLPTPGERAGAAATVQSVHKILSGLSQAAVLHVDPSQLDLATVRRGLQLIQTTSPHFAIMASIDLARRQMAEHGRELLTEALDRARRTAARLAAVPGLTVLRPEHLAGPGTGLHQLDETKAARRDAGPGHGRPRRRRPAQRGARRPAGVERLRARLVHHHDRQHREGRGPAGRRFRGGGPARRDAAGGCARRVGRRRAGTAADDGADAARGVLRRCGIGPADRGRRPRRRRGDHAVPAGHPAGDAGGAARRRRAGAVDRAARPGKPDQRVRSDDGVRHRRPREARLPRAA
ncbi:hypothetical protein JCM12141A_13340 [Mycolicibacterium hodleri]